MTPSEMPAADGESVARNYIAAELRAAQVSLNRTRLISVISVAVVLIYMVVLTVGLGRMLRPRAAADVVTGLVGDRVQEQAADLASQFKERVPALIGQAPDYALRQLPSYRETLENQLEAALAAQCTATAPKLEQGMDEYLASHKEQIKDGLATGQDPDAVKTLTTGLMQNFVTALKERPAGGESVQDKLDQSLDALTAIQKKTDRLAYGKNLTASEKKTRRAIAILTAKINTQIEQRGLVRSAANF